MPQFPRTVDLAVAGASLMVGAFLLWVRHRRPYLIGSEDIA
jgi:hypothetical protein